MRSLILLTLPALLRAQAPSPGSPEAVVAAERAFASDAARLGTPAAFLAHLAEEAIVFTPKPAKGWAVQRAQAEDGSRLSWGPERVEVAQSGDFALSAGPWSWTPPGAGAPAVWGHFLSLWRHQSGRWKVWLDVGTPHPEQPGRPLATRRLGPEPGPSPAVLEGAWAAFDGEAARDLGAALRRWASGDHRRYRKGEPLVPGRSAEGTEGSTTWRELGRQVASSRDLAVRWGLREAGGGSASAVQVWRWEGGAWRLAMDVALSHPPQAP